MDPVSVSQLLNSEEQKLFPDAMQDLWPNITPPAPNDCEQVPAPQEDNLTRTTSRRGRGAVRGVRRNKKSEEEEEQQINRGHWLEQENKRYHWFLELHYQHFVNSHMRRTDKIFKTMQLFLGTRQAEQCRSHHQKMQKKFNTFIAIISHLRQTHYNSLLAEPIKAELELEGIPIEDHIPTIQQLMTFHQITPQQHVKAVNRKESTKIRKNSKKQTKIQTPQAQLPQIVPWAPGFYQAEKEAVIQEKQQRQDQQGNPINMFDEVNHNIGDISLYHLKEDSYPFQGMFQPNQ